MREELVAFGVLAVIPTVWLGIAWGMDSVRKPRATWHRRMRWSWVVAIGIVSGLYLVALLSTMMAVIWQPSIGESTLRQAATGVFALLLHFTACAVAPMLVIAFVTKRIARATGNWCVECGYDLRATHADRCPECGLTIDRTAQQPKPGVRTLAQWTKLSVRWCTYAVLAGAIVGTVGFVSVDWFGRQGVPANAVWCPKCGTTELRWYSSFLGLPQANTRCFEFAEGAECSHTWASVGVTRANTGGVLLDPQPGDAILWETASGLCALEVGKWATNGAQPVEAARPFRADFAFRWREGPGSLMDDKAHSANIVLEFALNDSGAAQSHVPPKLIACDPAAAEPTVRALLRLPCAEVLADPLACHSLTLGKPVGSRSVPAIYDRFASSFPTQAVCDAAGKIESVECIRSVKVPAIGVVPAAQWQAQRSLPSPAQGVPMHATGWDRFTKLPPVNPTEK